MEAVVEEIARRARCTGPVDRLTPAEIRLLVSALFAELYTLAAELGADVQRLSPIEAEVTRLLLTAARRRRLRPVD